jgi:serine protease Do
VPSLKPSRRSVCLAALGALASGWARAGLPELIAAARPSVLPVGTYRETDSPRFSFRGTGFVVGDGTRVITNFHVLPSVANSVDSGSLLVVQVPRGGGVLEQRVARVLRTDRVHDMALLHVEGEPLPALTLAGPELVPEGTEIAFIGFPIGGVLGFSPVTHHGIVSSVTRIALPAPTAAQLSSRALTRLREGDFSVYQLDATAYPGNSGGPVFEVASGHVIGVINMVLVKGTRESALTNPTGISYAIPVRFVRALLGEG